MFELDKERFGSFVAERRKSKALTQKELAAQLYVSDKAVSKWERGQSLPDVSLLMPLAECLGVSVAELLECKILEKDEAISAAQVDDLVKKALTLSEKGPEQQVERQKRRSIYIACVLILTLEGFGLYLLDYHMAQLANNVLLISLFGVIFGFWAWISAKERLPAYYDENKVSVYSDGIFRMNMAGTRFTNHNWPHILKAVRIWTACAMTVYLPLYLAADKLLPPSIMTHWVFVQLALALGGIFVPIYWAAFKYSK